MGRGHVRDAGAAAGATASAPGGGAAGTGASAAAKGIRSDGLVGRLVQLLEQGIVVRGENEGLTCRFETRVRRWRCTTEWRVYVPSIGGNMLQVLRISLTAVRESALAANLQQQ